MAYLEDSNGKANHDHMAKYLHNKLLYTTIAIDYLHSTVGAGIPEQRFRANFKNYVDDPLSRSANNVTELIEILEQKNCVGLGDYDILVDITKFDARILKEIEYTKTALCNHFGIEIRRRGFYHNKGIVEDCKNRCKYAMS